MRAAPLVDPQRLRAARMAAGLTQHQLARRIGVAGGERISRWELGTSLPRPETLQRLAEELGVGVHDLLRSDDDPDLRWLRTTAGLSARELAARAHMSLPTLTRWESGRLVRIPSAAALAPLAKALGVAAEDVHRALERARDRRRVHD